MKRGISAMTFVVLLITALECRDSTPTDVIQSKIQVTMIDRSGVPKEFTSGLVYEYEEATVNAEALLAEMLNAGIPVVQAWLPLDNICMGPVGPRFTVELQEKDGRMSQFSFKEGTGRLECATTLKHYVITK